MGGLGLMKPWEIYWATIQFEDSNETKRRPILVTKNGDIYQLGFKMTTKNRDGELEYRLNDYVGAGLNRPTLVRLSHKVKPSTPLKEKDYIGEVQQIDRKEILRICDKHKIDKDDLDSSLKEYWWEDNDPMNQVDKEEEEDKFILDNENDVEYWFDTIQDNEENQERYRAAKERENKKEESLNEDNRTNENKLKIKIDVIVSGGIDEKIVYGRIEDKYDEQTLEDWYDFAATVEGIINRKFIVKNISLSKNPNSLSEYIDFYRKDENGDRKEGLVDLRLSSNAKKSDKNYRLVSVVVNEKQFDSYTSALKYINTLLNSLDESIKEGVSGRMTVEEIAKKHNVPVEDINKQLEKGIKVEKEHTNDKKKARRIALDHLFEIPDYYDRLNKMEKGALKEEKEDTITLTDFINSGDFHTILTDDAREFDVHEWEKRVEADDDSDSDNLEESATGTHSIKDKVNEFIKKYPKAVWWDNGQEIVLVATRANENKLRDFGLWDYVELYNHNLSGKDIYVIDYTADYQTLSAKNPQAVKKEKDMKIIKESTNLNEGTSNFWSQDELPLFAWLDAESVYDDAYNAFKESGLDDEEMDDFIDDYLEKEYAKYRVLDYKEDEDLDGNTLEGAIDDFNYEIDNLAREIENKGWEIEKASDGDAIPQEAEDYYDDANLLYDLELKVKPGYYQGAQLYLDGWDAKYIPEEYKKIIIDKLNKIGKDFSLMKLGVAWRASNGETGYKVLDEDTVKTKSGKWVNKGNTGETHGEFKTKKAADEQRKAMFAQRKKGAKWGESLEESMGKEVRDWWNEVETWNYANGYKYDIDNSEGDDEDLLVAMYDMLMEIKDENVDLYNRGKKIYNKYAQSKITENVEDNITKETIRTPRGTFEIYKGTWEDFQKEDDVKDWGLWFDHYDPDLFSYLPDDQAWEKVKKQYRIMHNNKTQDAIAVVFRDFTKPMGESINESVQVNDITIVASYDKDGNELWHEPTFSEKEREKWVEKLKKDPKVVEIRVENWREEYDEESDASDYTPTGYAETVWKRDNKVEESTDEQKGIKLTKDNKAIVKEGSKLYSKEQPNKIWTITSVRPTTNRYGQAGITVGIDTPNGHIYGYPISKLYGMYVIND